MYKMNFDWILHNSTSKERASLMQTRYYMYNMNFDWILHNSGSKRETQFSDANTLLESNSRPQERCKSVLFSWNEIGYC